MRIVLRIRRIPPGDRHGAPRRGIPAGYRADGDDPGRAHPGEERAGRQPLVPPQLRARGVRVRRDGHRRRRETRVQDTRPRRGGAGRRGGDGRAAEAPPVQNDLMVDQAAFFERYRSVKPFLINEDVVEGKERLQSPAERAAFDDTTSCILCGACYSACPVFEKSSSYIGPAALVSAARFIFDSGTGDSPTAWRCWMLPAAPGRARTISTAPASAPGTSRSRRISTRRRGRSTRSKGRKKPPDDFCELPGFFLLGQVTSPGDHLPPRARGGSGNHVHRRARNDPVICSPGEQERLREYRRPQAEPAGRNADQSTRLRSREK